MKKKNHTTVRNIRNTLSSNPFYTGHIQIPTHIQLIQYNHGQFEERQIMDDKNLTSCIKTDYVNWIRVTGMTDPERIIQLTKEFGLNVMDAKDILTTQHIISIEEYDDNIFIVLPATYYNANQEETTEHLAFILGKNYLISFQESNYPLFENIFNSIKENSLRINNKKADFLLASMLHEVIGYYSDAVSQLEDALEDMEDQLLDTSRMQNNSITTIQAKRREMIRLRKLLLPFKEQLAKLLRADNTLINEHEIPYFKDIYDELLYILQNIESCREIMSSLVDLYLNNNDLKMNIVMKQLTAVATIFIPLTFLAGVWGMNFKTMPELSWSYGYLYAWAIMLFISILTCWWLKKKKWF